MASIRRTLSPMYQDRVHENGAHKGFTIGGSSSKYNSSQSLSFFTKLLGVTSDPKSSRRGPWRRPFYQFLIFFLLGFVLGLTPFGNMEDVNGSDRFSFDIKQHYVEEKRVESNKNRDEVAVDAVSFVAETEIGKREVNLVEKKLIIVVTPTYNRAMQAYYLNRLAQTLRLVESPVLWIVVEMNVTSFETSEILRKTGVMYRHLNCTMNMTNIKDRGVYQRNTALEHIELHKLDGIVYFADDDNIYSLELFKSLRQIR